MSASTVSTLSWHHRPWVSAILHLDRMCAMGPFCHDVMTATLARRSCLRWDVPFAHKRRGKYGCLVPLSIYLILKSYVKSVLILLEDTISVGKKTIGSRPRLLGELPSSTEHFCLTFCLSDPTFIYFTSSSFPWRVLNIDTLNKIFRTKIPIHPAIT